MKQMWICELCKASFETPDEARCCETTHKIPFAIRAYSYNMSRTLRGSHPFPKSIVVQFSEDRNDTATYKLELDLRASLCR